MTAFTRSISTDFQKQVYEHPQWRADKSKVDLKKDGYAIIQGADDTRFEILWLDNLGKTVSIPFRFNPTTGRWYYENGQAHNPKDIEKTIAGIFKHHKEVIQKTK